MGRKIKNAINNHDSYIWYFRLKLNVLAEMCGSAEHSSNCGIQSTGRMLQTPAGLNTGSASKPWMWVLQSHDYLSSELLMTCTGCVYVVMAMYRSGGIAPFILNLGAKVSQQSASCPIVSPPGTEPPPPQLPFARWL
jgi:hypothetical protein